MPKYIDADALNAELDKVFEGTDYEFDNDLLNDVLSAVDNAPAADVEPVVRCENCQFFENVEYWPDGTKKVCQLLKRQVQENSFCCWGMKKEVEDG